MSSEWELLLTFQDPGFNMPVTNSMTYRKIYKGVLMAAGRMRLVD